MDCFSQPCVAVPSAQSIANIDKCGKYETRYFLRYLSFLEMVSLGHFREVIRHSHTNLENVLLGRLVCALFIGEKSCTSVTFC